MRQVNPKVLRENGTHNYVVKSGDCLWNIAKAQYGSGTFWSKISRVNRIPFANPDFILVGEELYLPTVPVSERENSAPLSPPVVSNPYTGDPYPSSHVKAPARYSLFPILEFDLEVLPKLVFPNGEVKFKGVCSLQKKGVIQTIKLKENSLETKLLPHAQGFMKKLFGDCSIEVSFAKAPKLELILKYKTMGSGISIPIICELGEVFPTYIKYVGEFPDFQIYDTRDYRVKFKGKIEVMVKNQAKQPPAAPQMIRIPQVNYTAVVFTLVGGAVLGALTVLAAPAEAVAFSFAAAAVGLSYHINGRYRAQGDGSVSEL